MIRNKRNIKILDCTLRDGGRPFDCKFTNKNIKQIIDGLNEANIDIVELGFLRNKNVKVYNKDKTFFNTIEEAEALIVNNSFCEYTLFVDFGLYNMSKLSSIKSNSKIRNIRYAFSKIDYEKSLQKIVEEIEIMKEKGYNIYLQPINILSYSKAELFQLVKIANEYNVSSFAIVDTYGSMYMSDLKRITKYLDRKLLKNINILFHSHNSYQLSFALSLAFINMRVNRTIIVDATLSGIGKCAGNLPTELICDFLNFNYKKHYKISKIYDLNDKYILKYKKDYDWGYSQYTLIQGKQQVHPNNVIYLQSRNVDAITADRVLSKLDEYAKLRYFYDKLDELIEEENNNGSSKSDKKIIIQKTGY